MAGLEDRAQGATIKGIVPHRLVTLVDVQWHGSSAVEVTYKDAPGYLGQELLYGDPEAALEIVMPSTSFGFDGEKFRLASEDRGLSLPCLSGLVLALHTSTIEPLPHQITAVYGEMLPRQPRNTSKPGGALSGTNRSSPCKPWGGLHMLKKAHERKRAWNFAVNCEMV